MTMSLKKITPNDSDHDAIAVQWARVLSNTYFLAVKTQYCHWNVVGPHFQSLHALFESQYGELFTQIDDIAERLRALGYRAPGSFDEFQSFASINQLAGDAWEEMVSALNQDHQHVNQQLQHFQETVLAQSADEVSMDFTIQLQAMHQKTAWMLSSHLA